MPLTSPPRRLTGAELDEYVRHQAGPAVIDVAAEWCAPCQLLAAFLPKLGAEWTGALTICQADGDNEPAFCSAWDVDTYPQLLLFASGSLQGRVRGFSGYVELRRALAAFIAETTGSGPLSQPGETAFGAATVAAEQAYEAAMLPTAEALGRVLEPVWPEHEASLASLDLQLATGAITAEQRARAATAANDRLARLAGTEMAAQRTAMATALVQFKADIDRATLLFVEASAHGGTG